MDNVSHNVSDLAPDERSVLERLIGAPLAEHQRIGVQLLSEGVSADHRAPQNAADYAILSDLNEAEADRLVDAMRQRSPSRRIEL